MTSPKEKCNCTPLMEHDGEKITPLHANYCASTPKTELTDEEHEDLIKKVRDKLYPEHKTVEGWEAEFDEKFVSKNYPEDLEGIKPFIAGLILKAKEEERDDALGEASIQIHATVKRAVAKERERILAALASWIDDYIGASSTAIYLYMSVGLVPRPFDAPRDSADRARCQVLLRAVPEFIPRLVEIEDLKISGKSNDVVVYPWNEQIPLIRAAIEQSTQIQNKSI